MNKPTVAAIIPAHNEQETIADVVSALVESPLVEEVLVVSDGSTDATVQRATHAGAFVLERARKGGKGEAMAMAAAHTSAPVLAFFDADLLGLNEDHIERLLLPVINGGRAMNVGIRDRGWFLTWLSHHMPLISGERALLRHVFEAVPEEYLHGFMVETSLNYYCRSHKLRYGAVDLPGLHIRRKYQKVFFLRAVVQYIGMFGQVLQAMLAVRLARFFGRF